MLPALHRLSLDVSEKRTRSGESVDQTRYAHAYANAEKLGIRTAFALAARCGSLLYLDDTGKNIKNSATADFLNMGYKEGDLIPVNFKPEQCIQFTDAFKVDSVAMDLKECIHQIWVEKIHGRNQDLSTVCSKEIAGIWIDLTGYTIDETMILNAMDVATHVVTITFTSVRNKNTKKLESMCPNSVCPATDMFACKMMKDIEKLSYEEDGTTVEKIWKCVSRQVYGAKDSYRSMNMINLQFQRKNFLNDALCFDLELKSTTLDRPPRVVTDIREDISFAKIDAESEFDLLRNGRVRRTGAGRNIAMFFKKDKETPGEWRRGTIQSSKPWLSPEMGDESWEGKEAFTVDFKIETRNVDLLYKNYMLFPAEDAKSWVSIASPKTIKKSRATPQPRSKKAKQNDEDKQEPPEEEEENKTYHALPNKNLKKAKREGFKARDGFRRLRSGARQPV